MLAQLPRAGVEVDEKVEELDGVGRFGWAVDPRGEPLRALGAEGAQPPSRVLADERRMLVEEVAQHGLLRRAHLVEAAHGPAVRRLLQELR